MINRIMKPRAAALAFAAPLLIAAPAFADHDRTRGQRSSATISLQTDLGAITYNTGTDRLSVSHYDRYYGPDYRYAHGRDHYRANRRSQRRAARACRRAITSEAYAIGFHDVDFDSRGRVRQIGPGGFLVTYNEVEFEGRRREFERRVTCTVRRGTIVRQIEGLPRRGHHRRDDRRRHRH